MLHYQTTKAEADGAQNGTETTQGEAGTKSVESKQSTKSPGKALPEGLNAKQRRKLRQQEHLAQKAEKRKLEGDDDPAAAGAVKSKKAKSAPTPQKPRTERTPRKA